MAAKLNGDGSPGLTVGNITDVGAHGRRWVDETRAELDREPRERVRVVARPYLGEVLQHARVEPPAAARAALPEHVRKSGGELLEDAVETEHIGVIGAWVGQLVQSTIGVPLDIRDRCRGENICHGRDHEVLNVTTTNVKNELAAALGARIRSSGECPIWVLLVQGRVRANHLGLEPETELHLIGAIGHVETRYLLHERCERARREPGWVDLPICHWCQ